MKRFDWYGTALAVGLSCLFLRLPVGAQPAALVRDINSTPDPAPPGQGAEVSGLRLAGDHLFYSATGEGSGEEVWSSDGTPSGTGIVQDTCPGPCGSGSELLGSLGRVELWFQHFDRFDVRLWRSDGTPAGTYALTGTDLNVAFAPQGSGHAAAFLGRALYFPGCAGPPTARECDLWRSDGTVAGTAPFHTAPYSFVWLQVAGDRLFYLAATNGPELELWVADGTAAGTRRLRTFRGVPLANRLPVASGRRLFFLVNTTGHAADEELWTSDGTAAGTIALTRLPSQGTLSPLAPWLKEAGGKVYFSSHDGVHGWELWRTDGTTAGTVRLSNFARQDPLAFDDVAGTLAVVGGNVLFEASEEGSPRQIWVNRGGIGAVPLVAGCGEGCSTGFSSIVVGGRVHFSLHRNGGFQFWSTDGTEGGNRLISRTCATGDCTYGSLQAWKGELLFGIAYGSSVQVWSSDGTPGGVRPYLDAQGYSLTFRDFQLVELRGTTYLLASVGHLSGLWARQPDGRLRPVRTVPFPAPSGEPGLLGAAGARLLFTASERRFAGRSLWSSAGDEASTVPLDAVGAAPLSALSSVAAGGLLYYQMAGFSSAPVELWRTDGTAPGTFQVAPLQGGAVMAPWQGGLVYFDDGAIWRTDGTVAGTVRVGDLPAEIVSVERAVPGPAGLYLQTVNAPRVGQIWVTDGTPAGTRQLTSFPEDSGFDWDPHLTPAGSSLYFARTYQLWRSDGTSAGTVLVQSDPQKVANLAALGEAAICYRASSNFLDPSHLWRIDGTAQGTVQLAELAPLELTSSLPPTMVPFAGKVYLNAEDGAHGRELWATDGTPAGTGVAFDLVAGMGSSEPHDLTIAGGWLYFSAADPGHGRELWVSDGTAAGTRRVQDIAPQAGSSSPEQLTPAGDKLYFTADDGVTGRELWVLPLSGSTACRASDTRLCLGGGRYAVEAAWRTPQGAEGRGHAAPLTADTGTFWFFDPSNVEAVLKVLDGTGVNGHVWVFYGALSNVEYTLTVTDTQSGLAHRYVNPQGELASVGDTQSFGPLGASLASVTTVSRGKASGAPFALASSKVVPRAATGACAPSSTRLCLNGNRYAVEVAWKDFAGNTGVGQANGLTVDTGWFWFFSPTNVELVLKVLDGTPVNGHRWVFYGALSSVEYTVTVTDTQTGEVKTYRNPSGQLASVADTAAF